MSYYNFTLNLSNFQFVGVNWMSNCLKLKLVKASDDFFKKFKQICNNHT